MGVDVETITPGDGQWVRERVRAFDIESRFLSKVLGALFRPTPSLRFSLRSEPRRSQVPPTSSRWSSRKPQCSIQTKTLIVHSHRPAAIPVETSYSPPTLSLLSRALSPSSGLSIERLLYFSCRLLPRGQARLRHSGAHSEP